MKYLFRTFSISLLMMMLAFGPTTHVALTVYAQESDITEQPLEVSDPQEVPVDEDQSTTQEGVPAESDSEAASQEEISELPPEAIEEEGSTESSEEEIPLSESDESVSETPTPSEEESILSEDLTSTEESSQQESSSEVNPVSETPVALTLEDESVPLVGTCFAHRVISAEQGNRKNGTAVLDERSDIDAVLGVPQNDDTLNFYSLGFGGEMVVEFYPFIMNVPGDDVAITETSFNNPLDANYPESANVYASFDGNDWVLLGSATLDESFDLGSLDFARYIKIVDTSNPANFGGTADGYDIDGISAIECGFPEPVTCYAHQIVSVNQGLKQNDTPVDANRSNPLTVLGAPQNDDTLNFYSLGFGGEMVVAFDLPILNVSGDDVVLTETTFGNRSYESYPETAAVFASQNGVGWVFLGFAEHDASFDLGSLSWAQYIKIVDISETDAFGPLDDAFDIDALEGLCGYPESYDEEHGEEVDQIPPRDTDTEETPDTDDETPSDDTTTPDDETDGDTDSDTPSSETETTNRRGGSSSGGSVGTSGLVLGAFDAQDDELGMVLGEFDVRDGTCGIYLTQFLRRGVQNDTGEVRKLQEFLNLHMNAGLLVDGIFGIQTEEAVNAFQIKYWEEILAPWAPYGFPEVMKPSGWVYKTTQRKINMIHCPSLNLPIPPLP